MSFDLIFDKSYERVMNEKEDFFDLFYDLFLNSSPQIPPFFKSTDMNKQKTIMRQSFYKLFTFYASHNADETLEKIAIRHDKRHLDIHPKLYDLWLECMIKTVEAKDPMFSDEIELAWRLVLSPGIVYMKFMYEKNSPP